MSFSSFAIEAGINSAPDVKPAGSDTKAPAPSGTAPSVPSTTPTPTPTPAADTTGALDDDADLDLGFGDGTDENDGSDSGAPAVEADADSADDGVDATKYQPPAVDGVAWNGDVLSPIVGVAARHGIPQAALDEALQTYASQIQEMQADLKRQDKERMAETRQKLTPGERGAIDAAAAAMPRELRSAIKQARLPDGSLLLHQPEFLHLLAGLNRSGSTNKVAMAQNDAAREAQIRQVMRTDYEGYVRQGLDTELAAILRRRGAR